MSYQDQLDQLNSEENTLAQDVRALLAELASLQAQCAEQVARWTKLAEKVGY